LSILSSHLDPDDRAGLITFADDVRTDFPLTVTGPQGGPASKHMMNIVTQMRTRGRTKFYAAVLAGANELARTLHAEPDTPKWLVALTDGADNLSSVQDWKSACEVLGSVPKLNLALISVGDDVDLKVCNHFLEATTKAGNTAMLVKASDQAEIAKAFESVAEAMGGVAEVL